MLKRWQKLVAGLAFVLGLAILAGTAPAQDEINFEEGVDSGGSFGEPAGAAPEMTAPMPPEVPGGQTQYRLHQVGKEENLHILAAYYYGDARQWTKIYDLNKKSIRNPNVIREGQILKIDVPVGWAPRFSLPEFMEKERKRVTARALPPEEKPRVIRESEEVQLIPRLLPVEEEEEGKGEKGEKKMLSQPVGGVPGVEAPPESPLPPEETEGGGAGEGE